MNDDECPYAIGLEHRFELEARHSYETLSAPGFFVLP